MSDEKTPLEQALDLFVYAPFGLFITVTEEMPKLVDKGRQRLTSQLTMARMMGEMAAPQLQAEAEKMVKGLVDRLAPPVVPPRRPAPRPSGDAPSATPPGSRAPSGPGPAPTHAAPTSAGAGPDPSRPSAGGGSEVRPPAAPAGAAAAHLSIPGYDALSAMQVVQRLAGLDPQELEAVRSYESAHRGRKTILSKAEQLLAEK